MLIDDTNLSSSPNNESGSSNKTEKSACSIATSSDACSSTANKKMSDRAAADEAKSTKSRFENMQNYEFKNVVGT
jgi:hypothetical protein